MTRWLAVVCVAGAVVVLAGPREPVSGEPRNTAVGDAGTAYKPLSAAECDALVVTIVNLAVTEELANDPEVKQLTSEERAIAEKLARKQALEDSQLASHKRLCPKLYTRKQADCISAAKSMADVDTCGTNAQKP